MGHKRSSDYGIRMQHRLALENKFGGDIQAKLLQANDFQKVKFLQEIFNEFDEDNSGELDMREFFIILRTCGFRVSMPAAVSIMQEVDVDENGFIDIDEFVEFFKKMDDLEAFRLKVEMTQHSTGARKNFITGYIFLLLAGCGGLFLMDVKAKGENALVRTLLIAFSVLFAVSIFSVVLIPIFSIKFKPDERMRHLRNQVKKAKSLPLQKRQSNQKTTAVEVIEIPAPPYQGAIANASTVEQHSYRKAGRSEASKLSHRSHDGSMGPGSNFGDSHRSAEQVSIPILDTKREQHLTSLPARQKNMAVVTSSSFGSVPAGQNNNATVVQAPQRQAGSYFRRAEAEAKVHGDNHVSQYSQARQLAEKDFQEKKAGNVTMTDTSFNPWSHLRHGGNPWSQSRQSALDELAHYRPPGWTEGMSL